MKSFVCPELLGISTDLRGQLWQWGIVEYVQDILLKGMQGSVENCDFTLRLSLALTPLRGPEQVGQRVRLMDDDVSKLQKLASLPREHRSPQDLVAFATYNRTLLLAESVTEESASPLPDSPNGTSTHPS